MLDWNVNQRPGKIRGHRGGELTTREKSSSSPELVFSNSRDLRGGRCAINGELSANREISDGEEG